MSRRSGPPERQQKNPKILSECRPEDPRLAHAPSGTVRATISRMSRARLAATAIGAATALLLAVIGLVLLVSGHASVPSSPSIAGALVTGAPTATAVNATTGAPELSDAAVTGTAPTDFSTAPTVVSSTPKHVLAGYWQDFVNHAIPMPLAAVPRGYDLVDVAFAAADPQHDGGVAFTLSPALAQDIATLHGRGQRVLLSVNNAGGAVSINSPAGAANFAKSISDLMRTYGFD